MEDLGEPLSQIIIILGEANRPHFPYSLGDHVSQTRDLRLVGKL